MKSGIKKILDTLHRGVARDPWKLTIHPDAEWKKIFFVFWLGFGAIGGWSLWVYYQYAFPMHAGEPVAQLTSLSKDSFTEAFNFFDQRAAQFEEILQVTPLSKDPGLR